MHAAHAWMAVRRPTKLQELHPEQLAATTNRRGNNCPHLDSTDFVKLLSRGQTKHGPQNVCTVSPERTSAEYSMDGQSRSSTYNNSEMLYLFSRCLLQQFSAIAHLWSRAYKSRVCHIDGGTQGSQGRDQTANAWSKQAQNGNTDQPRGEASKPQETNHAPVHNLPHRSRYEPTTNNTEQ